MCELLKIFSTGDDMDWDTGGVLFLIRCWVNVVHCVHYSLLFIIIRLKERGHCFRKGS